MTLAEDLKKLADKAGGMFRTSDLNPLGVTAYAIQKLIGQHIIVRVKPGYYRLAKDEETLSEAAQIAQLFPDGVLCMYTALFYFGYSDRTPLSWDIAVNKNTSKSRFKLEYPFVQPYYLKPELLAFGVTEAEYNDCRLKIFDRDRLICECIFSEDKIDKETYNKAIQGYIADPNKNIQHLLAYAQRRRILKKVKTRIGVWL
jgi:predicted transcriptional regulator of viral defense system